MGQHDGRFDHGLVLELIPLIYDAAMDASRWQAFLDGLDPLYPDSGRALWYESRAGVEVDVLATSGFEPQAIESYATHYGRLSPWTDVMQNKPSGHVHTADMIVPEHELARTEFYNDWLRPQKLASGFGATVLNEGDRQMYFSILPPRAQGSGERDLAFLRQLVPHLQRAAAIHSHFARMHARAGSLEALVDHLDIGAILVAEDRRIAFANKRAESLLERPDGLLVRSGTLGAWDRREDRALRAAVLDALATAGGERHDGGCQLAITRPSGRRPLSVLVMPVFPNDFAGVSRSAEARPVAGIFVSDPEADRAAAVATVAQIHGLTEAEASIVGTLLTEGSLPQAAARLRISHETARSHLKAVFTKTGTNSQAELVRLALTAGAVPVET